jgi:hypothetical protein
MCSTATLFRVREVIPGAFALCLYSADDHAFLEVTLSAPSSANGIGRIKRFENNFLHTLTPIITILPKLL